MFDILLSFVSKRPETHELKWIYLGRDAFNAFISKIKQYNIKKPQNK